MAILMKVIVSQMLKECTVSSSIDVKNVAIQNLCIFHANSKLCDAVQPNTVYNLFIIGASE